MLKYHGYSESDLLKDNCFVEWLLMPTDESDRHWSAVSASDSELALTMDRAAGLFRSSVNLYGEGLDSQTIERLHGELMLRVSKTKSRKKLFHQSMAALLGAAAVFALFLVLNTGTDNGREDISAADHAPEYSLTGDDGPTEVQIRLGDLSKTITGRQSLAQVVEEIKAAQTEGNPATAAASADLAEIIVPYGRQSSFSLSDGTEVLLNSGSKVIFPLEFDPQGRVIEARGEIYLDVVPDGRPFTVKAGSMEVRVLGTSFGITCHEGDSSSAVVLVEGSVEVGLDGGGKVLLQPGDMLETRDGDYTVRQVDVMDYLCWKEGWMQTRSTPLRELAAKLSRYYNVNLSCSEEVAEMRCTGKLILDTDFDALLTVISQNFDIGFELLDDRIELRRN